MGEKENIHADETSLVDQVAEEFWARYARGQKQYRPPLVDNTAGRLAAYKYLQEVADSEAAFLEEISDVRFVG